MYRYKTIIFDIDGVLIKTDTILGEEITKENAYLLEKAKLNDEVIDMFDNLKRDGYKLFICSNNICEDVNRILNVLGIADRFSIIKCRIEGLCKSQLIKQILDESACCSAVVVGDNEIDYEAANHAGCLSIGVSYEYGHKELEKADFIATSPIDIYHIINKINNLYNNILHQIMERKNKDNPFIVGINGVDTSGKTEFTTELGKYISKAGFKVQIVSIDDFHNPSRIRSKEEDPVISYTNNAFNLQYLANELLEPITAQGFINKELRLLDLQKDEYSMCKTYEVDKNTIVLVEGVLLYREPIDSYFNYRIYLDISFDEVLKRASQRDGYLFGQSLIEKYQQKYIPVQKLYIDKHKPKERSDMLILNEDYRNPVVLKSSNIDKSKMQSDPLLDIKVMEAKYYEEVKNLHLEDEVREMLGVTELPDESYFQDKSNICYVILSKKEEFVGIVELFNLSWKNRRAELSIVIKASYRGTGYGSCAIKKLLDIGFQELGLNRIWLRVLENNTRAIECYKKVGFIEEGICREESLRRGQFKNQVQMSILRSEWLYTIDC